MAAYCRVDDLCHLRADCLYIGISSGQGAVAMICGWEGNRRSGVVPTMRHRFCDMSSYRLRKEK